MIDWPFEDLIINESDLRTLFPPSPRLVIFYEILNYFVAVSKSAQIIKSATKTPLNESIQSNGTKIQWLALRKEPLQNLVRKLNRPIALTRIDL